MARVKREPGAEPKPKAPPKTDPLEGLDYTVEKVERGQWRAECLGMTSYGPTKKQALVMLALELNGFKDTPSVDVTVTSNEVVKLGEITQPLPPAQPTAPAPAQTKGEAYSIDDAEILWGIEYPSKPELFRQLLQERISLKIEMDRSEERIKEINKSLLGFYSRQGIESVKWEDWTVARVNGGNSTLDKEALVLAGVPADLIAQCTKRKEYTTVRVTGPKRDE